MLYSNIIKPILYGNWLLRITNDHYINNDLTYIKIQPDIIKIRTLKQAGIIGIKKSRTAIINNIELFDNDTFLLNLNYSTTNIYSYSVLGIEIPEIKSTTENCNKTTSLNIKLFDKSLYINDNISSIYYIFDLYIGNIRNPYIETNINTFIFTQIVSLLLNLLIEYYIHFY